MLHGMPDSRRRNVNELNLHNLRQIHENGKEKAHKAMSELLEKILSNENMNMAYKKVCANKGKDGVARVYPLVGGMEEIKGALVSVERKENKTVYADGKKNRNPSSHGKQLSNRGKNRK